ncbi:MAG: hypothetical protein ACRDRA_18695 [Pseudonocardiaceae bacterium]
MAVLWTAIGIGLALLVALPVIGFWQPWSSRQPGLGAGIGGAVIGLCAAFVLGLVGVSVAYSYTYAHYDERVVECTVTGIETRGQDTPLIATQQCGVLEGSGSSPIWRRGDSVDVIAQIQLGQTYRFRVVGWRSWWTGPSPRVLRIEAFS